jgi:hypothetical protein
MVELDNLLGGGPVQHREDQGEESQLFLSYFPTGMNMHVLSVHSGGQEKVAGDCAAIVCCVARNSARGAHVCHTDFI